MEVISTNNCHYLTAFQIRSLNAVGIKTFIDFVQSSQETICSALSLNDKEFSVIRTTVLKHCQPCPITLLEIITPKLTAPRSTGINGLDDILGGGIRPRDVIEIFGKHGSGKSWLCTQLVSQFFFFDADPSNVLYFDMKNDFNIRRLAGMCGLPISSEPDKRLERVLVVKGPNLDHVLSLLDQMKNQIIGGINGFYSKCRFLVIDSLPMLIYPAVEERIDQCWRLQQEKLVEKLNWIANRLNLAIVLVNHAVSLRSSNNGAKNSSGSSQSTVKPALGKYWLQKIHTRLYIENHSKNHVLTVAKNCRGPEDLKTCFCLKNFNYA